VGVGVTQPGGAGTTIMFQTDTSAPNGLYYRAQDFAAAFPADFVALGTTPQTYRAKVSVQNGDGVLGAATSWKDTRGAVFFDTGRTYIVNATGLGNRLTEWGSVLIGATGEPLGYDGMTVYFGTNPTLQGVLKFYGCSLANINPTATLARILITPNVVGTASELIDSSVFTLGTQAYGSNTGEMARIRRLTAAGTGSGVNGRIVQFNCPDADEVVMFFPNGIQKINTGGYVRIGHPTFLGPSTTADTQTSVAGVYENPIWSQNVVKGSFLTYEEWMGFGALITNVLGVPIAGVPVSIWDPFDSRYIVTDILTGAFGTLDYLGPQSIAEFGQGSSPFAPFRNALLVNGHNNDGVEHEHTPFTIYINTGPLRLPQYLSRVFEFSFPYSLFLATEKQYSPLYLSVQLESASSPILGNEEWRPTLG